MTMEPVALSILLVLACLAVVSTKAVMGGGLEIQDQSRMSPFDPATVRMVWIVPLPLLAAALSATQNKHSRGKVMLTAAFRLAL